MRASLRASVQSSVAVRRAETADLDRVMQIDRSAAAASHWSLGMYAKYVNRTREQLFHRCLLVAVADEGVIGFAVGSFLEGDEAAVLESVVVDVARRRNGIATALFEAIADWAKVQGARAVELEVRAANEAARALYAGLQFVESGRRKNYYSDPVDDAILMALRLEQVRGLADI